MQHPARVSECQRFTHPPDHAQALSQRRLTCDVAVQPRAAHELHSIERPPVGQSAGFIDWHDARMLEPSNELRFTWQVHVQDLEGHTAVEFTVSRGIDHTHPAAADFEFQLIPGSRQIGQRRYMAQMVQD